MGPHVAAVLILLICIALVVLAYALGVEVGRSAPPAGGPGDPAPAQNWGAGRA